MVNIQAFLFLLDFYFCLIYSFTMKYKILFIFYFMLVMFPAIVSAIETAPRIQDREIIEKLTLLEAGQRALDQRITDLRAEMKSGQEAINLRINDINNTMLVLFGAIITLIVAIFAYIAWDRRTMFKSVDSRLAQLEKEVVQDLDLFSPDGSKLKRLIDAMRELAKTDEKVADVLRSFSLL